MDEIETIPNTKISYVRSWLPQATGPGAMRASEPVKVLSGRIVEHENRKWGGDRARKVVELETGIEFSSAREAAEHYGLSPSFVRLHAQGNYVGVRRFAYKQSA